MLRCFHALLFLAFAFASVRSDPATCDKVGPQCGPDGKEFWMCADKGKEPSEKEECKEPQSCRDEGGRVACMDPPRTPLHFKCTGAGEFPDPKDCSRTYICSDGKDEPAEVCDCPGGSFVYPERGLFCVPDECPRKNIACSEGASGHFELTNGDKTGYFYYCSESDVVEVYVGVEKRLRTAFLREMKNGKECKPFAASTSTDPPATTEATETTSKPTDSTTGATESTSKPTDSTTGATEPTSKPTDSTTGATEPTSKPTDSTTGAPQPTSKPTDPTTNTPSPSTPKPEEKPKCKKPGDLYKTECDCDFYQCDKALNPVRRTCRPGMLYYPTLQICIYGRCDETKCIYRPK